MDFPPNIHRIETVLYKGYTIKRYKEENPDTQKVFFWMVIFDIKDIQLDLESTKHLKTIKDAKSFIREREGIMSEELEEESEEDFVERCFKEFELEV